MRCRLVHEQYFPESEKLIEHLHHQNENTVWIKGKKISELQFLTMDEGLYLNLDDSNHQISECARESIFERLGMDGQVLNQLPLSVLILFMNEATKVRKGKCQVLMVEDKIDAILSDNKTGIDYSMIPAYRVFEQTQQWVWENIEKVTDFKGSYSHSYVFGKWITGDSLPNISNRYLTFSLATSDIGKGAICYRVSLANQDEKYELPICSAIKINHRTENTMSEVYLALDMLHETAIQAKDFKRLAKQSIEHPRNCLLRISKKLKFPKKAVCEMLKHFPEVDNITNAMDLYLLMGNIPTFYKTTGMVSSERLQGDIYKAVALDWSDYDIDGYFVY